MNPAPISKHPSPTFRFLRRVAWAFGICSALLLTCYVFRAPLLTELARIWIVNDPVTKADAIVVLGGGVHNRPAAAAKLFHDGFAPKILYMDVRITPIAAMGVTLSEREMTRRVLLTNGVPETAMEAIGDGVASTFDESRAVRAWLEKNGAKTIIIPTDMFHTRRVRWIFWRQLRNTNADIRVLSINLRNYDAANWWRSESGVVAFQNEITKTIYYHLKY